MKRRVGTRGARGIKKSTPAARRLIRAALRRHGTQARAARALGLPSQAQLSRMLAGTLGDTPAMKAALVRADARGKRAWALVKETPAAGVDAEQVQAVIAEMETLVARLKSLVRTSPATEKLP